MEQEIIFNNNDEISSFFDKLHRKLEILCSNNNPYSVSNKVTEIKYLFYNTLNKININDFPIDEKDKFFNTKYYESKFNDSLNKYENLIKRYRKKKEKEYQKNLKLKKEIINKIKIIISERETINKTFEKFKLLQKEWKETGKVPKNETDNIWKNYNHHVEKFYDYIKINNDLRDIDFKKNLYLKEKICDQAEKLLKESSIKKSFEKLQELHDIWKEIGPVSRQKREDIWKRFQDITKEINKAKIKHHRKILFIYKNNLDKKNNVCRKIKSIIKTLPNTHLKWQKLINEMDVLLKEWKKSEPIAKKDVKTSWKKLNELKDNVYSKRREFYSNLKKISKDNLKLKIDICQSAEIISKSTNWDVESKKLINLQKRWNNIPYSKSKKSLALFQRFNKACNIFFESKKRYYEKIKIANKNNITLKNDIIKKINLEYINKKIDKEKILKYLKEWNKIELTSKKNNSLEKKFSNLILKFCTELKIDKNKLDDIIYNNRLKSIKNNKILIKQERKNIINQINKINNEINNYENNILFLSNSKKTDSLLQNILMIIENSKNKVEKLEKKLKLISK